MKVFTKLFVVLGLLVACQFSKAQDIHFSQFYASPLLLNPARTGNVAESWRGSVIYRNQWASIPAPYSTIGASFDISVLGCQLGVDHVGVGLALFNDRAGDGNLNDFTGLFSLAYHKGLDKERRYMLSLGGALGFKQKSVDFTSLLFQSQITSDFEFDPALPNGEPVDQGTFNYLDFRAGGLITAAFSPTASVYFGGAYYHFSKPRETFLLEDGVVSVNPNLLDPRLVAHFGGFFLCNRNL